MRIVAAIAALWIVAGVSGCEPTFAPKLPAGAVLVIRCSTWTEVWRDAAGHLLFVEEGYLNQPVRISPMAPDAALKDICK